MTGRESPSRRTIIERRALAVAIVIAAATLIWLAFFRSSGDGGGNQTSTAAAGVSPTAAGLAAQMTPDELARQVLLVGFDGTTPGGDEATTLGLNQFGGVIVGTDNWADATTGEALVKSISKAARQNGLIPPLMTVAQEGGDARALPDMPPSRSELDVGEVADPDDAEAWAAEAAHALHKAGFDLDLFPVADVATLGSPLGARAFSDDPSKVTGLTAAALSGCARGGITCAALHFPGLGAASGDTNRAPATVALDADTLANRDMAPFVVAFGQGMPAVVLSLAFYSAFDSVTPAALSPAIATDLLRNQLGFTGVAITDDLGAGAVRFGSSVPKAAVTALAAGSDLIQIDTPADTVGVPEAIVEATNNGTLSLDRLREAASRVLALKESLGLLPPPGGQTP
jgi:beta-N-acetylhexosaminidase